MKSTLIAALSILAGAAAPTAALAQVERAIRPTVSADSQIFGVAPFRDGYVSIGRALTANNQEVAVLTMHTLGGAVIWQRFYQDVRACRGYAVVAARDGGIAFAGETAAIDPNQAYTTLVKTDPFGNILWTRAIPATTYGAAPIAVGLRETREGNLAVVSRTRNAGAPGQFCAAAMFTPAGGVIWSALYRDPRFNIPASHFADLREVVDAAGARALMVVGATAADPAAVRLATATILREADGAPLLVRQYNFLAGPEDSHGNGLLQISPQQFRLTGRYTFAAAGLNDDAVVWDIDPALNPVGVAALYRDFKVARNAIEPSTANVGVTTLAGWRTNPAGAPEVAMLMTLSAAPPLVVWANVYDGPANAGADRFHALFTTPNSIIAAGMTANFAASTWFYTARTDPLGRDSCETRLNPDPITAQTRSGVFEWQRITLPVVGYAVTAPPQNVFQRIICNPCPADFNEDGFLDFFDYDDYVNCYENGVCPPGKDADFNNDGFVDFFDYDDFVAAYERGC